MVWIHLEDGKAKQRVLCHGSHVGIGGGDSATDGAVDALGRDEDAAA